MAGGTRHHTLHKGNEDLHLYGMHYSSGIMLQCITVQSVTLHCIALHCIALQNGTLHCSQIVQTLPELSLTNNQHSLLHHP